MKILFVCQQYIHSARWINQLKDSEHEIFLFDCLDMPIHQDLKWTSHFENWSKRKLPYIKGEHFLRKKAPKLFHKIEPFFKTTAANKLVEIIDEIQPDLVHSLEMQSQTYHVLKAFKKHQFKWAYFSWGSDLFLYQNDKNHRSKIKNALGKLDYFLADNNRDVQLAKELGFKNKISWVFPGGGGYHLKDYKQFSKPFSERNLILIKGYHHWAGRALVVLNSLELILEEIKNYRIYVYSAHKIVIEKIEELNKKYNLNIEYSSRKEQVTHQQLLVKFGEAKIAIGNSISDGIPNTLLEAIILGAFPIQSNPGDASEDYISHKSNGLLIENPEDKNEIAELIKEALESEKLIEKAFKLNSEIAKTLDYTVIKKDVLKVYQNIEKDL